MKMMALFKQDLWMVLVSLALVWGCAQQVPGGGSGGGAPGQATDVLSIGDAWE